MRGRGVAVITTVACLFLGSCGWTQYRYGPAHTGHNPFETTITRDNVARLRAAWSGPQLGIPSDPVVAGGSVFVGYEDDVRPAALSALDAADGSVRWSLTFPSLVGIGTPTYAAGRLYVPVGRGGFENATLNAYRAGDGARLWSSPSPLPFGAPAVVGDLVYQAFGTIESGGFSHGWEARHVAGGDVRFRATASGFGQPSVAVADGFLYAGAGVYDAAGVVRCSGGPPKTCTPLWSYTIAGSTSAISDGLVFVTTESGTVAAFPAHGCGRPTCAPAWTGTAGTLAASPAAVAGGLVFVSAQDGALYAFRASGCGAPTCPPLWIGIMRGGGADSPPSVANGIVFAGALDGKLHAFSTGGCVGGWCPPLWTAALTGQPVTTPVVADGSVLVGTTDRRVHTYRLPAP